MDYDVMAEILQQGINRPTPTNIDWKPLKLWKKMDGTVDKHASYHQVKLSSRLAGSCHELLLFLIRPGNDETRIVKRIIKLARDEEEDNEYHFEVERQVAYYLSRVAKTINHNVHART